MYRLHAFQSAKDRLEGPCWCAVEYFPPTWSSVGSSVARHSSRGEWPSIRENPTFWAAGQNVDLRVLANFTTYGESFHTLLEYLGEEQTCKAYMSQK
jgi:hypothetical protein